MTVSPPHGEHKKYQKELVKLQKKSDYYRHKCARRALRMSRMNKSLELLSIIFSVITVGCLSGALSGLMSVGPAQKLAIVLSSLIALSNAIVKPFFDSGEFVKLFYAAGEFLEIKESATKLKLQCDLLSDDDLRIQYERLADDYISLKKAYIEYTRISPYRGHKRRMVKILGKDFAELPPMRGAGRQV